MKENNSIMKEKNKERREALGRDFMGGTNKQTTPLNNVFSSALSVTYAPVMPGTTPLALEVLHI